MNFISYVIPSTFSLSKYMNTYKVANYSSHKSLAANIILSLKNQVLSLQFLYYYVYIIYYYYHLFN